MTTPFDTVAWAYDAFTRRTKMYSDDLILQGNESVADLGCRMSLPFARISAEHHCLAAASSLC